MPASHQNDSLSPEKMQLFLAGLAGLPRDEVRKAKLLYLRNAISEYEAAVEGFKAFGCVMMLFAVIPLFWPLLLLQWRSIHIGKKLLRDRIENAMIVWQDDLQGEHLMLPWG